LGNLEKQAYPKIFPFIMNRENRISPLPIMKSPGLWRAFLLVAVGIFMATLDESIVNIAVPIIMRDL
jgi:hypothetical protein